MVPSELSNLKRSSYPLGQKTLRARFAKWLSRVRQEQITLTVVGSPRRSVRPFRLTVSKLYALTGTLALISFITGASLVSMAVNYQVKTVALNEQLRLAQSLQDERDYLQQEVSNQEERLVHLAMELRTLQTELAEIYAVREQIFEVLPDSVSNALTAPTDLVSNSFLGRSSGEFADELRDGVLPAGGPVSRDDLLTWTEGTLEVSRKETSQLLNSFRTTYENALQHRHKLDHTPSIWPAEGWISSEFGSRIHPITGARTQHNGIDIAAHVGTEIVATADGVVTHAGPNGGYGLTVIIDHDYGIETLYAHASAILVNVGEKVRRGQLIARIGSTGLSTGPHLHYEVRRNSRPINPREMLP